MRCTLCGDTTEVAGLDGLCMDRTACWARADRAAGMVTSVAIRQMELREAAAVAR